VARLQQEKLYGRRLSAQRGVGLPFRGRIRTPYTAK